uniref:Uncharacterized protein n=1 Tax=Chromera velia CCMP2878 TaxID=1169474 RepID=A0A0K6S860_9ALVE|eukprot:Cvel_5275.t1-p1 / transcript=Cvel_5275.t1 / gene=Cvel_5275 / organism=Chromera_velia_CCMP2878 / gene_product=hypothetical protein / transcript_product=hypothetical protein / location=Cvel_scaffold243:94119-95926(-) / protein_length=77 / sequence_SO=supercontig / SO=protein_coding / is_pseudo=false
MTIHVERESSVKRAITRGAYELIFPAGVRIHPVVNVNYLKKYVRELGDPPPAVRLPRFEGPEYKVDRILDSKRILGK